MTSKNDKSPGKGERDGGFPKFKSTLPLSGKKLHKPTPKAGDPLDLDLEVDDIQSRLPYGSEDIADK